jgi:signal peptidase I
LGLTFGLAIVRGASMEPTLHDGERLLVRYGARGRPGRLAVVRLPADADGRPRPVAVKRLSRSEPTPSGPGWWIERDNPAYGVDSWQVGAIAAADVVAIVVGRLWPRPSFLRRVA